MRHAIAIDIGATWIRAAIISDKAEILYMSRVETRGENVETFRKSIEEVYYILPRDLIKGAVGVGIGSIGPMDLKRGILNPPNILAKNINLREIFSKIVNGMPTYLANDTVAAAIGEFFYGDGVGTENLVYITLSTGIGAGVIVDGEPLVGKDGNAHEIGHLVIERSSGIECGCGGIGHWEGLCGGLGIGRLAEAIYTRHKDKYRDSSLAKKISVSRVSAKEIYEAFYNKDPLAIEVVEECNEIHAAGVASVINAYDPEKVIMGGSIILNNRWLLDEISKRVDKYLTNRKPIFSITRFGDNVVLVGAATVVLKNFRKKERFRLI